MQRPPDLPMPSTNLALTLGSPQFSDGKLAAIANDQGDLAAWFEAFTSTGDHAPAGVTGDFAVAVTLSDNRSFLAVDRFAIRTMCYRIDDGRLRFAARADELADSTTEIDPQAIFDYLYFHAIPSPRTIYKGIFRLPPAHCASFENGQFTLRPYCVPSFSEQPGKSFGALKDEFCQIVRDGVAKQLDGSKVGCFLSGGTDSSTVAGMAALVSGNTAATYSIGFDAQGYDEMEIARLASKHFKTEHHEYYVTPSDLVQSIASVATSFDQPFGNSSALPSYYCAKMAFEDGVTKILAGDGGDELFGGNSRYAKQKIFDFYGQVPGFIQKGFLEPLLDTPAAAAFPLTRKAASYVEQARVPMPDRLQMYNLITRLGVNEVLTPQFLAQIDTTQPLQLQRQVWMQTSGCSALNKELAFDWRFTLAESDLPKVVGATSLAGIDVGFPMLDDGLLAFSLKLPTGYKLKGQKLRWFFKEALRGFLPDDILTKKKQGFGLPFGVWANTDFGLKALASDSLRSLANRGVVRADFVETLLTKRLPEHPGYFGEMVWILMMLEQWLAAKAPNYRVG